MMRTLAKPRQGGTTRPDSGDVPITRKKVPASAPVLPERYEDRGVLARGGYGEVRRVLDRAVERMVAMKLLALEHLDSRNVRARFDHEARVTATLEHPGIIPVHDRGVLADGRPWFTMKEVRGQTFDAVIAAVHTASSAGGWGATEGGWTMRRLVESFARIAETVGYAHSRGIVHRDLKPKNLMVGAFGEVLVMDWGIAQTGRLTDTSPQVDVDMPPTPSEIETSIGEVFGTLAYMSPEQARGEVREIGAASDVFSLGLVLFELLCGARAFAGPSAVVWARVADGRVPTLEPLDDGPPIPEELVAVFQRATARLSEERYPTSNELAAAVRQWLDGDARRNRAREMAAQALALAPEIEELRAEERRTREQATSLAADLRTFDPVEKKRSAWRAEDEADRLVREIELKEAEEVEILRAALQYDETLPEAHERLADLYRSRLADAEARNAPGDAARWELLLRRHDRGRNRAFLDGRGALTLHSEPRGARALLRRFTLIDRRLVLEDGVDLGRTPIDARELAAGSYVVELSAAGHETVRYALRIGRDEHWDGVRPGSSEPTPIALPARGTLGPDDVYVPSGFVFVGGDALAPQPVPRQRVWIDAFVMRRFPVTNAEYIEFLDDLVATGRAADAERYEPRATLGTDAEQSNRPAFARVGGRFVVAPDENGREVRADWPVALVDWHAAIAYAAWCAEKTGAPWRVPNELEWEKAARGADERAYPWGAFAEPTWACILGATESAPSRASIHAFEQDVSPYGIRGLAGNVRDWCADEWKLRGPDVEGGVLRIAAPSSSDEFRVIRGGAWNTVPAFARSAGRFASRPTERFAVVGFRIARSV
jgi:serine/threonine-protein kinase